jgi:hypothetical protein
MPLDIFWSLRTADLAAARAIHRLTATSSLGIRLYADGSNHSNGLFSLQAVVESPRQASLRNSFHRGPGIHGNKPANAEGSHR